MSSADIVGCWAIRRANLPPEEKRWMIAQATDGEAGGRLMQTNDFQLIRWFHEHGVPQVVHFERDPYVGPV